MRGKGIAACLAVAGVLGALAYVAWTAGGPARPTKNVLLVLLDTFRVDRLGCQGNPGGMTPELDRFAHGAARFERAFSHAPWTLPSVASILTSRYPMQHGAGGGLNAFTRLPDGSATLAGAFRRAGATTGQVTNVFFLSESFGLTQGVEHIDADVPDSNEVVRRAGPTTDAALAWIDKYSAGDRPFFLFVHYFDAHLRYDPPQPFRRQFADPKDREGTDTLFGSRQQMIQMRAGAGGLDAAMIGRLEKLYNGEVAYVDSEVGRLLAGLTQRRLDGNTVVAITADHGEEFLDHGGFEHGHTLYDELLHVPLIIRSPGTGSDAGRVVSSTVRHVDLAPTLCELAGVPVDSSFIGESLTSLMAGHEDVDRPVLSSGNMWGPSGEALRASGMKLICEGTAGRRMLFDVGTDPREKTDISGARGAVLGQMTADLDLILREVHGRAGIGTAVELSAADRERLRALGYLK